MTAANINIAKTATPAITIVSRVIGLGRAWAARRADAKRLRTHKSADQRRLESARRDVDQFWMRGI